MKMTVKECLEAMEQFQDGNSVMTSEFYSVFESILLFFWLL